VVDRIFELDIITVLSGCGESIVIGKKLSVLEVTSSEKLDGMRVWVDIAI